MLRNLPTSFDRRYLDSLLLAASLAVITAFAYSNYFIQDDGFISLRYADHWARGYGPVWYPGSTEFGYTNFLFVALCALLIAAGTDPVVAAGIVTYSGFILSILATYAIVLRLTGKRTFAALCILVVFTNYTVSSYASGLLETSLQTGLVLSTYYGVIRYPQSKTAWLPAAVALSAALAMLTRLDSALLLLPAGVYALWHVRNTRDLAVFLLLPTLIVGAFLIFCQIQYGQLLPTTFYVKAVGTSLKFGITYIKRFLNLENFQYAVFLSLILVIVTTYRKNDNQKNLISVVQNRNFWLFSTPAILWVAYVIYVGGGFMGFRLMVPFIVLFFILTFYFLRSSRSAFAIGIVVIYALTTNISHKASAIYQADSYRSAVNSPVTLHAQLTRPDTNWPATGRRLGEILNPDGRADITIATTASGAIPFFSRLNTIDILGLNDRWVAENGYHRPDAHPGHRRWASLQYLRRRHVNLAIGNGKYLCGDRSIWPTDASLERYGDAPILLIEISRECRLVTRYLTWHPGVERLLAQGAAIAVTEEAISDYRQNGHSLAVSNPHNSRENLSRLR